MLMLLQAVPVSCLYTPLKERRDLPLLMHEPVECSQPTCRAILNPFCQVDFQAKFWACAFCARRNELPIKYTDMCAASLPTELLGQCSTCEYTLQVCPCRVVLCARVLMCPAPHGPACLSLCDGSLPGRRGSPGSQGLSMRRACAAHAPRRR